MSAFAKNGESTRREILGGDYVDRAIDSADSFSMPFQDVLNDYC
jgi:4-carboxymuconolactone decarboxylase